MDRVTRSLNSPVFPPAFSRPYTTPRAAIGLKLGETKQITIIRRLAEGSDSPQLGEVGVSTSRINTDREPRKAMSWAGVLGNDVVCNFTMIAHTVMPISESAWGIKNPGQ